MFFFALLCSHEIYIREIVFLGCNGDLKDFNNGTYNEDDCNNIYYASFKSSM